MRLPMMWYLAHGRSQFLPTHMARSERLAHKALQWIRGGGFADFTADKEVSASCQPAVHHLPFGRLPLMKRAPRNPKRLRLRRWRHLYALNRQCRLAAEGARTACMIDSPFCHMWLVSSLMKKYPCAAGTRCASQH